MGPSPAYPRDDSEWDPGEMWEERSLIRKNRRCKGRRRDRACGVWRSSGGPGKGGRREARQEACSTPGGNTALRRTRASSGRASAARSACVRATDGELTVSTKLKIQCTSSVCKRQATTCCKRSTHRERPHSFYNFKNQQPIHVGVSAFTA